MQPEELPRLGPDEVIIVFGTPGGTPEVRMVTRNRDIATAVFNDLVRLNGQRLSEEKAKEYTLEHPGSSDVCEIDGEYFLTKTRDFEGYIEIYRVR